MRKLLIGLDNTHGQMAWKNKGSSQSWLVMVCCLLTIICGSTVTALQAKKNNVQRSILQEQYQESAAGNIHYSGHITRSQLIGKLGGFNKKCGSSHLFHASKHLDCNKFRAAFSERCKEAAYDICNDINTYYGSKRSVVRHQLLRRRRAVEGPIDTNDATDLGSGEVEPDKDIISPDKTESPLESKNGEITEQTGVVTSKKAEQTTVTTTSSPSTTKMSTSAQRDSTTSITTQAQDVIIPDSSPRPPYVVVTDEPVDDVTEGKNMTLIEPPVATSSAVGAIVGTIIAVAIVAIIIVILVILVKKKKIKIPVKIPIKRKKIVTRMENPQYQGAGGQAQAFRFSRDSTLYVGPTANLTKFNNPKLSETPVPKVLQTDATPGSNARRQAPSLPASISSKRDKRRAPVPPNPFESAEDDSQLYEKASQGSAEVELQTFTVKNEKAEVGNEEDKDATSPLLKTNDKSASLENGNVKKEADKKDSEGDADDNETTPSAGDNLLPKDKEKSTSADELSADFTLDEYDMTRNPFFAK